MPAAKFEPQPDEIILQRIHPDRKWYLLAWRIFLSLFEWAVLILIVSAIFLDPVKGFLSSFFPPHLAATTAQVLCFGLAPLLIAAWQVEDLIRVSTHEIVLTNQRIWMKGSPYAWSSGELPIDEIESMAYRRGAIFLRTKDRRKLQVLMFPNGRDLVKIYEQSIRGKAAGKPRA